jgi:hypothetical protein
LLTGCESACLLANVASGQSWTGSIAYGERTELLAADLATKGLPSNQASDARQPLGARNKPLPFQRLKRNAVGSRAERRVRGSSTQPGQLPAPGKNGRSYRLNHSRSIASERLRYGRGGDLRSSRRAGARSIASTRREVWLIRNFLDQHSKQREWLYLRSVSVFPTGPAWSVSAEPLVGPGRLASDLALLFFLLVASEQNLRKKSPCYPERLAVMDDRASASVPGDWSGRELARII